MPSWLPKEVMRMKRNGMDMTVSHDVATLLGSLASQLRRDGLALTGLAHEQGDLEDDGSRTLVELAGGQERAAMLVDGIRQRLCRECKLIEVDERWVFSRPNTGKRR
jgi:hypothetical protein